MTTRRAIYSKTSVTPSPVLAEVKKSLAPRSGLGGIAEDVEGDGAETGVVDSVAL